jgi:hypothetical protein
MQLIRAKWTADQRTVDHCPDFTMAVLQRVPTMSHRHFGAHASTCVKDRKLIGGELPNQCLGNFAWTYETRVEFMRLPLPLSSRHLRRFYFP